MDPIPEQRRGLRALDPTKEAAREQVGRTLRHLLAQTDRGGEEWRALQLQKERISVRYTHDKGGVLRGVSFELNSVAVRGQEVGYKGAQLREVFAVPVVQAVNAPDIESPLSAEKATIPPKLPLSELRKGNRRKGPAL